MTTWRQKLGFLSSAIVVAALAGCGGGGSDPPPPVPVQPPVIGTQPQDTSVVDGANATFSVSATGTGPLTYQWRRNGAAIAGATGASLSVAATLADSGSVFAVVVTNPGGPVTSSDATLTVTPAAPAIVTAPQSTTVSAGQSASFTVVASGSAPLAYQWRRNSVDIAGAVAATYTTPATTLIDNGAAYSVVVTNAAGSAPSGNAILTVTPSVVAPAITQQPAGASVAVGQTATFAVLATGTAPLAYQWRRDGVAIAGATAAGYTTPAAALTDNGARFSVVVTNGAGSAVSNDAVLSVAPASFTGVIQDGSLDGNNAGFDAAAAIATDPAGNMFIAASCIGTMPDADPSDTGNVCVVKYDPAGTRVWSTKFGGHFLTAIALDANGNIYAAGWGTVPGQPTTGGTDAFVFKFNADGIKQWVRQFGSDRDELLWGLALDGQANVVVTGTTHGSLPGFTNLGSLDAFLAKLDTNGNPLWINQFGPSVTGDDARAVVTDAAGDIYVGGAAPEIVNGSPILPVSGFVAKFTSGGTRLFLAPFRIDAASGLSVRALAIDESSSRLYVAAEAIAVGRGTVIAALDLTGQVQWLNRLIALPAGGVGTADAMPQSIVLGPAGGVFVTGWTNGVMPGQGSAGGEDIFVLRCEVAGGALAWTRQIGSTPRGVSTDDLDDAGNGIALDPAGDLLVTGVVRGVLGTPRQVPLNRGIEDWFIARVRAADGTLP